MDPQRKRLAMLLAALALVAVVAGAVVAVADGGGSSAPAAGPRGQAAPADENFGASVNWLFNGGLYPPVQIEARLHDLRVAGATVARTDALWEEAEPQPPSGGIHHYDWTFDDQIAFSLAAVGLQWLPIIDYTAGWDESVAGQDHSPPRSATDFAAFGAALAARYGRGGAFWREHPALPPQPVDTFEVWNEPDVAAFWSPTPDASTYADLYLRTRDAITAADPSARVIIGGLAHPGSFLPALLKANSDLRGHVDGVAIHPYAKNIFYVLSVVRTARHTLNALGMGGVPLYVTEVGWTTHPRGARNYVSAQARPGYISSTVTALGHTDCDIAATVVYSWVTPEGDVNNREDWFGLQPPAGGVTADTTAFATGVRGARSRAATLKLCR
jgi:polysaccharide biosynthesis protein PslG